MNIRLLICDLDGTLLDTLDDIAAACNDAMQRLGQPTHPPDDFRLMVGDGADVLVRRALPANRQELAEEALHLFKVYYNRNAVVATALYAGIAELLDELTARGVRLAILTNKPQAATEIVVRRLLGQWKWVAIAGHREAVPKKPDPTAALAIARALGIPAAECGFLGDSHVDMRTATAAGMIPLGAGWGFREKQELLDSGAQVVLDEPGDLLKFLPCEAPVGSQRTTSAEHF